MGFPGKIRRYSAHLRFEEARANKRTRLFAFVHEIVDSKMENKTRASAVNICKICATQPIRNRSRTDFASPTITSLICNISPLRTEGSLDIIHVDCGLLLYTTHLLCKFVLMQQFQRRRGISRFLANNSNEQCVVRVACVARRCFYWRIFPPDRNFTLTTMI